jgi:hypothetical protein
MNDHAGTQIFVKIHPVCRVEKVSRREQLATAWANSAA